MNLSYRDWLRNSNEAKPFRDAFELCDKMPNQFSLKLDTFNVIQNASYEVWDKTKRELSK